MKNRLRSERRQGSATASRRATRVLDRFFASAPMSVIKGADAPFFFTKKVLPMSGNTCYLCPRYVESQGGSAANAARAGVTQGQTLRGYAWVTSPRAIFDRAALLTQEGVTRLLKADANLDRGSRLSQSQRARRCSRRHRRVNPRGRARAHSPSTSFS